MRIITVNLPTSYLGAMDALTGEDSIYPSRSELIRVAVRDFLIEELKTVNNKDFFNQENESKSPMEGETITVGEGPNQKRYKLVKKK